MKEINLDKLSRWQQEEKPLVLVDVRERDEHFQFNIGGILVPLTELNQHLSTFKQPVPIVLYCKRGMRSQIAIQRLQYLGIEGDFINLRGGILPLMAKEERKGTI